MIACSDANSGRNRAIELAIKNFLVVSLILSASSYGADVANQAEISQSPLSRLIQQPTVTTIYQDKNLMLWVGTQHGLYRFNGSDTRIYSSSENGGNYIPVSDVRSITQDIEGNILVATFGGGILTSSRQDGSFQRYKNSSLNPGRFITNLYSSKSGVTWIGSESGVSRIPHKLTAGVDWFDNVSEKYIMGSTLGFIEDSHGNIVIATPDRLWLVDEDKKSLRNISLPEDILENGANITAVAIAPDDSIFIGSDKGYIFRLSNEPGSALPALEETTSINGSITKLLFKNGDLWAGTNNGLFYIRSRGYKNDRFTIENSHLSNNHVTDLYAGIDTIWVGTYQGLNNVFFHTFLTFSQSNSGISNDVMAFARDKYDKFWVGTYDGLFSFDQTLMLGKGGPKISERLDTPDPRVMTLASRDDQLWIGLRQGGIYIYNLEERIGYKKHISEDKNLSITKIYHESESTTWVGTYNNGLFRITKDLTESFMSSESLMEERVTIIVQLENTDLLIGTETGIFRYSIRKNKFEPIVPAFDRKLLAPMILSLKQDNKGDIWIGTKDHGLYLWSKQVGQENNSPDIMSVGGDQLLTDAIYSIEIDQNGNIWCSTQSGIVKLSPTGNFLSRFDKSDGLPGNDFNFAASFSDPAGNLYFGGINGFSIFDPKAIFTKKPPSKLLLTKMVYSDSKNIYSVDVPKAQTFQLTHKNYFVTFEFSVLDFIDPENNQFRYKLEGFDPDWIENGTRNTATYTNLPAGNYVFRVQGANSSDVWNREGISINVEVLPPPWFAWWAWCAYIGLFAFFSWLGKRTYDSYAINRRANDMAITMRENEERAYDDIQEHQELNNELITVAHHHNVATLALIRDFIEEQKNYLADELAADTAEKCIDIVTSLERLEGCLFFHDNGLMADLRKYTDFIFSEKIKASHIDHESIITINDVTPDLIPADLASPIALVIHEAVENAMQHAFVDSSTANYLQVSLSTETENSSRSTLSITDNGVGIPEQLTIAPANTMGLGIIYSMARKLSARIEFSRHNGTEVSLTFANQSMNKVG